MNRIGNNNYAYQDRGIAFVMSVSASTTDFDFNESKVGWEREAVTVAGMKIVSYGENNNLPTLIRNIMDGNNLAPGILEREIGLLYGDGPQLYRTTFEGGQVERQWVDEPKIREWLNSWNYRRFVEMATIEYKYLKGFFVERVLNKGSMIGLGSKVLRLEVKPSIFCRLEWVDSRRLEDVKRIYVGDFENNCMGGVKSYPVWNASEPFRHGRSMSYHNSYSFARNFYSVPSYYGTLKWIMRSSDIPEILKYLTDNGISVAYHIHSPAEYWEQKRELLRKIYEQEDEACIEERLERLKDEVMKTIADVLAGKKNAGKFISTIDFVDSSGTQLAWQVEPIEHKVKDFIEAQLKISEKADSATTSGMGLDPSLSNIIVEGKFSSGSQMLYALKLYLASDTTIPEEIIFEPINQAIAANFPDSDIRMGFYRRIVMREESVNPEARVINTI